MLRRTILSQRLLLAFAATSLSMAVVPHAYAQSNASGSIFGQVASGGGTQVLIENAATGFKRTIPIEGGRFQATSLPPGHYKAQLLKDGAPVSTVELDVLAGGGAEAVFAAAGVTQLQSVQIVGRAPTIDVSSTTNASTFTAKQLDSIPIATKDLNGIISLASNTTKADTRYAGGISIGGGAPSENSYYINGFPATNALTQLGSIELPFGAIDQAQVQTGGFGAEFGRSVGGVVSVTTKSGTNEWHGGANFSVEPNRLRARQKDILYANTGANPDTDGTIYRYRGDNTKNEYQYGGYIGGPIIQDKLFFFFAADQTKTNTRGVNAAPGDSTVESTGWLESKDTNTRYLAKFDWNLTSNHRLEATILGDNYKTTDNNYAYNYDTHTPGAYTFSEYSKNLANVTPAVGGDAQILKYIGTLTDDLTLTALYGQSSSKHTQTYSLVANGPMIYIPTQADKNPTLDGYNTSLNAFSPGSTAIPPGAQDKTKSFRLDLEYKLGRHTVRAGLDENRLESINAGENYDTTGGSYWRYYHTTNGNFSGTNPAAQSLIDAGAVPVLVNGVPTYYYARQRLFDDATGAYSDQSAQYIEDRHQITDNILLTYGLRNESFKNKNGDGQVFLQSKNFLSPRFSAAWDVTGDSSLKVFGSAGRYSLQIPTHIAVRGASRSLFTDQYVAYSGVDPATGLPTGVTPLGAPFSGNNEYGQAKDVRSVSAQSLKPTFQDEVTLGIEKALTRSLTGGVKVTYRQLKDTIDDFCDPRPIANFAAANNINTDNYGGFGCATINPGKANTLLVDYSGTGNFTTVPLTAADIGLPEAKRTYFALDFFLEHAFQDGWYGKLTYTYSKSKGNTEGQTKSDTGQTDVAATSTWDFPELMEGAYGYLPNDRTHQIKGYGYYQLTPEWGVGTAVVAESGRPKNCFGNYNGTGEDIGGYGNAFFYCGGVLAPRGSLGRLPWNFSLDVNAVYKPSFIKGLGLRIDVFNIANRQSAQVVEETRENSGDIGSTSAIYDHVISYSAPRTVRLSAEYNF